jgi:putative ABC transport system permease protein
VPFGNRPVCGFKVVSPSYFRAVGLRLVRGRALDERDRDGAPLVVVINEMMARTYFSGVNPIGRRLLMRRAPVSGLPVDADLAWTVVGVAADEGVSPFDDRTTQAAVYVTREQHPRRNLDLVVRTTYDPRRVQESIRKAISEIDRDQAVADFKTVKQLQRDDVAPDRLRSMLLTAFAGLAVVLAVLGLYGVIAHAVVHRTQEIGIRAALGASPAHVLRLVLGQAVSMIGLGIVAGLGMSLAAARLLRAFLFGVGPSDPATLLTVAAVLAGVAVLACYVPARRATRIDPLVALRSD